MTNHLLKRGSRYYIRRKIPLDLQAHFQGRKEIVKALGTADPAAARKLVREESVRLDREFDSIRQSLSHTGDMPKTSEAAYDPLSGEWITQRRPVVLTGAAAGEYERQQAEYEEEALREDAEPLEVQIATNTLLDAREAKRKARHARTVSAYEEALRRIMSKGGELPAIPLLPTAPQEVPATRTVRPGASPALLPDVITRWAKERSVSRRTVGIADRVAARFREHCGNVPVSAVTRQHVITYKDKLLESGQTPTNTDKHLVMLGTLLNYAADNLMATPNIAKGVKVGERKNAKAVRLPFDLPALQAIFSSPVYTAGLRPARAAGEAAYWLPLLALLTGARMEELCQLRPEDVYEETYTDPNGSAHKCWVLRITNEGDNQTVKNAGSIRRFPIHKELLSRGFVEYAKSQAGKARIFDKLRPHAYGDEGAYYGLWFSEYLRKVCGVTDKRMVFHSFRHGFKDLCRHAAIPEDVSDALSGHSSGKVSRRYGDLTYPLAPLVDAVARIRVAGLKLPT